MDQKALAAEGAKVQTDKGPYKTDHCFYSFLIQPVIIETGVLSGVQSSKLLFFSLLICPGSISPHPFLYNCKAGSFWLAPDFNVDGLVDAS